MPRKKKDPPPLTLSKLNELWAGAGLPSISKSQLDELPSDTPELPTYLGQLLEWFKKNPTKRSEEMYCFIMYDIENNKIRRTVAKYLEQKGCLRVQKSVFFARLHRKMHQEIAETLREIQQCYENEDTIMLLPVGEDMLNSLLCIGKTFELELQTSSKTTLFF
jgi:CRISPR-associated protein Cas2